VVEQHTNQRSEAYIERDNSYVIESNFENPFVVILSGMMLVGKSIVFEIIKNRFDTYYWINFDDEHSFSGHDMILIITEFITKKLIAVLECITKEKLEF